MSMKNGPIRLALVLIGLLICCACDAASVASHRAESAPLDAAQSVHRAVYQTAAVVVDRCYLHFTAPFLPAFDEAVLLQSLEQGSKLTHTVLEENDAVFVVYEQGELAFVQMPYTHHPVVEGYVLRKNLEYPTQRALNAAAVKPYRSAFIYAEPNPDSAGIASAADARLSVIGRQGEWLQVEQQPSETAYWIKEEDVSYRMQYRVYPWSWELYGWNRVEETTYLDSTLDLRTQMQWGQREAIVVMLGTSPQLAKQPFRVIRPQEGDRDYPLGSAVQELLHTERGYELQTYYPRFAVRSEHLLWQHQSEQDVTLLGAMNGLCWLETSSSSPDWALYSASAAPDRSLAEAKVVASGEAASLSWPDRTSPPETHFSGQTDKGFLVYDILDRDEQGQSYQALRFYDAALDATLDIYRHDDHAMRLSAPRIFENEVAWSVSTRDGSSSTLYIFDGYSSHLSVLQSPLPVVNPVLSAEYLVGEIVDPKLGQGLAVYDRAGQRWTKLIYPDTLSFSSGQGLHSPLIWNRYLAWQLREPDRRLYIYDMRDHRFYSLNHSNRNGTATPLLFENGMLIWTWESEDGDSHIQYDLFSAAE